MNPFIQQLLNAARNTAGKAARNLDVQTLRNMGPSLRRATGLGSYSTGPITAATKQDPSLLRALPASLIAVPGTKTSLGLTAALSTAATADSTGLTGAIESGLNQIGPGLDRFFGAVTPKAVQDFGKNMEQYGWGALGGVVPGEAKAASISTPERAKGTQAILNGKPVYWTGSKYGWQSGPSAAKAGLLGSEVVGDDAFAPVSSTALTPPTAPMLPSPLQGAAARAYQQELSRTAQLTAQDPELQRYEAARAAANTPENNSSVRDTGMEMWQKKYGQTPMGQPGGAIGSFNPLMQSTFGYQTGMSPGDITQTITNPAAVPVGPGEAPYQMGDLGTGALAETGYDTTRYGVTPERIEEIKKQLLTQASAK
jgi:hypothetical protein